MTDAPASPQSQELLPELEHYVSAEMARADFIERGQAFLAALYQWLRDNNWRLTGKQALSRFAKAHDLLLGTAYAHALHHFKQEHPKAALQVALLAIGGYGRGEQFLRSDVDIMLLLEQRASAEQMIFVKSLMHLLIDLRLDLGYSTRTIADCEAVIGHDLDSTTAMTESRLLAGSRPLFLRFDDVITAAVRGRWRKWYLKAVYESWRERRDKYEQTVYLLEPHLKEGHGGLRDVHTVQWMIFGLTGSTELKHLKELAGFDDVDLRHYREAIAMLQLVRNEVHIASGSKNDQLIFAHQPVVANRLGYEADAHRSAEEVFMADYYRHARTIARLSKRAIRLMVQHEKSILGELFGSLRRRKFDQYATVQDELVFIDRAHAHFFEEDHRRVLSLFERAARAGYRMSDEALDFFTHFSQSLGPGFRLDPVNRENFLKILKARGNVFRTLSDMHECGVLDKFLPEFEHISCMVRIDYYHHYTVDEHSLKTLEMAERLLAEPEGKDESFAAQIAHQIERWDLLNLSLLLHDVGKGFGRGHALRGGQIAQRIGDRLGLPPADIDTVRFLVLSHLKLSHAAQRRDLADPQVATQLAEEIGTLERLKLLYVHSVCDLMAVSPEAFTDWKAQLMAECYMRTAEVLGEAPFQPRALAPNLQLLQQKVLAAVLEALRQAREEGKLDKAMLEDELNLFLKHVSDRYIQASSPETIARHFLLRRTLDEKNQIDWQLQPDTGAGFSELTVCAADVPGLFSSICGALAAKDINIWSAQIFSTTDGYALNQFQVTSPDNTPLPAGLRLDRLRQDLNLVLLGDKTLEALAEKHRTRSRKRPPVRSPLPSTVILDNQSSQDSTIIEVRTTDRPGLLHLITRALSECQLDIQRAIITTVAYGVVDVFYVTDLEYNKIYDATQRKKIEQTILEAIAQ